MGLLRDIGGGLAELVFGAYERAKKLGARKYPSVDELIAADLRKEAEQRARLAAMAELPDEKTPAERPSRMPPPPEFLP